MIEVLWDDEKVAVRVVDHDRPHGERGFTVSLEELRLLHRTIGRFLELEDKPQ